MTKMVIAATILALGGCASPAPLPPLAGYGPDPALPAPERSLLPVMRTARASAWPAGAAPTAPPGFAVRRFAEGLEHPRWVYVLPNGDVLVALSATELKPARSIMQWVKNRQQRKVGAAGPSPNKIILLRDADGDGIAEVRQTLIGAGLKQPFGMAWLNGQLYVGNTDSLVRYPYALGQTSITVQGTKIADLPNTNGHWTRNVVVSPDGSKLYVGVGSNTNIADNGVEAEAGRALILQMNPDGSGRREFATGLRNPNGMAFEPTTDALWTVVNERDMIGDALVPDYLTSVRDGAFYGWPWSYWGQHADERVQPPRPDMVQRATKPDYGLGSHTASLGLTFYTGTAFPQAYRGGAFIGQHGSWNSSRFVGYKVIFVPFAGGRPAGMPVDFLTGFLPNAREHYGRPVGVAVDRTGGLLVADDVGGIIWRVTPAA